MNEDHADRSRPFSVGDIVVGAVNAWVPFGILVELESGVMGVVDLLRLDPDGRRGDGWESVPRVGESVEMVVVGVDNDVWYTLSMRREAWFLKERWLEYAPRVEVGAVVPSVAGSSGAMIDATMFC